MYSDYFKWSNISHYYQRSDNNNRKRSSTGSSSAMDEKRRNNHQLSMQDALAKIVQQSEVFDTKREILPWRIKDEHPQQEDCTRPSSSVSVAIIDDKPTLESDVANSLLPTFDQIANFPTSFLWRKFFEDIKPLDRILGRVVRTGVAILHVELVCMLTRFRRSLIFMKGKLFPVEFDRTKRFYQPNDFISTTVMAISPNSMELELQMDEDEAILTQQGIPAYCRDFDHVTSTFDEDLHISRLRDNPNIALQLGVQINSTHSALPSLCTKQLHQAPTAVQLRKRQSNKLAMSHVKRGAELTKQNKCFEAIQCFNKALAVDGDCADAYVGRGAASAGERNFVAALQDFEKAIELQPTHRNANSYRLEVLMAFGRDMEKTGDWAGACTKYQRILDLCPTHEKAMEALKRVKQVEHPEVINLDDEEDRLQDGGKRASNGFGRGRSESMTEEEAAKNREKLKVMEEFIRNLKNDPK